MRFLFLLLFFTASLIFPRLALAQCASGQIYGGVNGLGQPICTTPSLSSSEVLTALGPIPTDPKELVKWILGWSIGIGGGIAFLLSLFGGATIVLNGSNPEKLNEGKEIISSAVTGLLFILFSVLLLRLIGVDILGIFS